MTWLLCLAFVLQTTTPPQQAGQSKPAATAPEASGQNQSPTNPDDLPVSVDRIRRRLSQEPAIVPDVTMPVFRIEVLGKQPSILAFLGTDFLKGPVPHTRAAHQESLTPA